MDSQNKLAQALREVHAQVQHLLADLTRIKVDENGARRFHPIDNMLYSNMIAALERWYIPTRNLLDAHEAEKQARCSPTLTECPRCRNDLSKCEAEKQAGPVAGSLPPRPLADLICAWANGFRVEFRYRHRHLGNPEKVYLSDEKWHLCGPAYSVWSGVNEHRIHADDLAAWDAFKSRAKPAAPLPESAKEEALLTAMHRLEDAYFKRGLPAFETAAEHIEHAAKLIGAAPESDKEDAELTPEMLKAAVHEWASAPASVSGEEIVKTIYAAIRAARAKKGQS